MPAARAASATARAPKRMHRIETLAAGFGEDGDEIDDRVGVGDGAVDRPAVAEVGLDRLDPADHAERLEVAGKIGPADRGADAPAALQERADDMAAEEARAAENRDQTLVGGGNRHSGVLVSDWRRGRRGLISAGDAPVQATERRCRSIAKGSEGTR